MNDKVKNKKDKSKRRKQYALYTRVSTEMQADKESLKTQKSRLKDYAKKSGITEYRIFRDIGSAKNLQRKELKEEIRENGKEGVPTDKASH